MADDVEEGEDGDFAVLNEVDELGVEEEGDEDDL